jgi:hypothetical protein
MRVSVIVPIVMLALSGYAAAQTGDACGEVSHLVAGDAALPHVAAAVDKEKRLTIVVAGTTSSSLPGPTGAQLAYPARLEVALSARLPGVAVKVVPVVTPRQSAGEMAEGFPKVLPEYKPSLMIWQTGTFDAMRGIDVDEFRAHLEDGIDTVREAGADVIMMNMQYSPRTDSMIALGTYVDNMRWVALEHELPLFDRWAIMKSWAELGTFDLHAAAKNLDTAARVHDCIGQLLADLIVDAMKRAPESKETRQ